MFKKHTIVLLFSLIATVHELDAIVVNGTDPNNALYLSSVTAVGTSNIGGQLCSGSLLSTGMHFLTAAHCVLDSSGNALGGNATLTFWNSLNQQFAYQSILVTPHPEFSIVSFAGGNDLAVITLGEAVDDSIGRLSLYSGSGELGSTGTVIGYGRTGTGLTGGQANTFGTRRQGTNVVDSIIGNVLYFDFDDGTALRSTLGGTGTGPTEVMTSFGDSGGPTLINGQIAGIHSFITCVADPRPNIVCLSPPDVDTINNSTYGERFGDTRVSAYTQWIQSIVEPTAVPEPSTWMAGLAAVATCLARARRTRSGSSSDTSPPAQ